MCSPSRLKGMYDFTRKLLLGNFSKVIDLNSTFNWWLDFTLSVFWERKRWVKYLFVSYWLWYLFYFCESIITNQAVFFHSANFPLLLALCPVFSRCLWEVDMNECGFLWTWATGASFVSWVRVGVGVLWGLFHARLSSSLNDALLLVPDFCSWDHHPHNQFPSHPESSDSFLASRIHLFFKASAVSGHLHSPCPSHSDLYGPLTEYFLPAC